MNVRSIATYTIALIVSFFHSGAWAEDAKAEAAALATAMTNVPITLEQGLKASEAQGKPISAKFEIEDGGLQLSVYTAKDKHFFEVIVDHTNGKIKKTEEIVESEDLEHANPQGIAMSKAKTSLAAAVASVQKANPGSRIVSIYPELKGGSPTAQVTLLQGNSSK